MWLQIKIPLILIPQNPKTTRISTVYKPFSECHGHLLLPLLFYPSASLTYDGTFDFAFSVFFFGMIFYLDCLQPLQGRLQTRQITAIFWGPKKTTTPTTRSMMDVSLGTFTLIGSPEQVLSSLYYLPSWFHAFL